MSFKKIEINGLHPANPLVQVIDAINNHVDDLSTAFDGLAVGQGVIGPTGPKGDAGADGREGPPGKDGKDGVDGLPGVAGPQGERGEQGPQGETGPAGRDGIDGAPGKDGEPGIQGPQGLPGKDGIDGAAGIQGPKGDTGETGPRGIQGVAGPKGDTGATGPQGIQGVKGDTGAQGIQGVAGPAGVGIKGFASGYVDAGQFVTLDNLKFTVTTSGSRGLSCATVSGTVNLSISGTFGYINGVGGSATGYPGPSYNTTPSGSWFGWSFPNAGDGSTYLVSDYTNQRFYRVTLMIGAGYLKNFISIERLY